MSDTSCWSCGREPTIMVSLEDKFWCCECIQGRLDELKNLCRSQEREILRLARGPQPPPMPEGWRWDLSISSRTAMLTTADEETIFLTHTPGGKFLELEEGVFVDAPQAAHLAHVLRVWAETGNVPTEVK